MIETDQVFRLCDEFFEWSLPLAHISVQVIGLPVIATDDSGIPKTLKGQYHIIKNKKESSTKLINYECPHFPL
jgi:hypothetical protein